MGLNLKRAPKFPPRRPRTAVQIRTVLLTPDDREVPISIKNISQAGFMGESVLDLDPETSFGVSIPDYGIVRARIRWNEDNKVGAYFENPLPVEWADPDLPGAE